MMTIGPNTIVLMTFMLIAFPIFAVWAGAKGEVGAAMRFLPSTAFVAFMLFRQVQSFTAWWRIVANPAEVRWEFFCVCIFVACALFMHRLLRFSS